MKLLEKLLKDLGVKPELAKQIIDEAKKDESTFDIAPAVAAVTEHQRMLLENDSEFVDKFKTAEKGKQLDIFTRDLKKTFGLSAEEIKDKKIDEIIELVKNKSVANSNKDIQKLQEDLIEATKRIKQYEDEIIPGVKSEVENTRKSIFIENAITQKLGGKKLRVAFEAAYPSVMTTLKEQFDIDIDDKKNVHLLQKGSKLKALKADKSGELLVDEFIDSKLKEWKFVAESNADDAGGDGEQKKIIIQQSQSGNEGGTGKGFVGAQKAIQALEDSKKITKAATSDKGDE